jgi:lactoylglutathione lyase
MQFLHTMLRVGDMPRAVDFYTRIMGMKVLRSRDMPEQKYSITFLACGAGNAQGAAELELTYNYGVASYDMGGAFGHLAFGVPDVAATCEQISAAGGKVVRPAGPLRGGTTIIAFVEDPDGYKIELIQR